GAARNWVSVARNFGMVRELLESCTSWSRRCTIFRKRARAWQLLRELGPMLHDNIGWCANIGIHARHWGRVARYSGKLLDLRPVLHDFLYLCTSLAVGAQFRVAQDRILELRNINQTCRHDRTTSIPEGTT